MTTDLGLRLAAVLLCLNGVGFGVFTLPAMRNLLTGRDVPIVLGFKAYGGGPFERHGLPTTVWLLAAFLLVCVAECVAGFLLWNGHRGGAVLALGLLPFATPRHWRPEMDHHLQREPTPHPRAAARCGEPQQDLRQPQPPHRRIDPALGATTTARVLDDDALGRITKVNSPAASVAYTYSWTDRDQLKSATAYGGDVTNTYNGENQLTQRIDATGTTNFTYDGGGRLETVTDPLTATTIRNTYDTPADCKRATPIGAPARTCGQGP